MGARVLKLGYHDLLSTVCFNPDGILVFKVFELMTRRGLAGWRNRGTGEEGKLPL